VIKAFLFQIESAVKVSPQCGKTFKSKSGFSFHLRHHAKTLLTDAAKRSFIAWQNLSATGILQCFDFEKEKNVLRIWKIQMNFKMYSCTFRFP